VRLFALRGRDPETVARARRVQIRLFTVLAVVNGAFAVHYVADDRLLRAGVYFAVAVGAAAAGTKLRKRDR